MAQPNQSVVRQDLLGRRSRLEQAIASAKDDPQLTRLLTEVDAALERVDRGIYGLCEVCGEPVEAGRLAGDPLTRFCLDHLTQDQQEALGADLEMASRIQSGLLPETRVLVGGWEAAYHYEAASIVSGDYCDLLSVGGNLYFVVGDVTGKGVSAAMLMAHLNAMFRALVRSGLALKKIMEQASRMLCESTLPTHFATLACGRAASSGEVELSIAGHLPILVVRGGEVTRVEASSLPLGMFCDEQFTTSEIRCRSGDTIILYTDGITEAVGASGEEYGVQRLAESVRTNNALSPEGIIAACLSDLSTFRSAGRPADDVTVMAIRRL